MTRIHDQKQTHYTGRQLESSTITGSPITLSVPAPSNDPTILSGVYIAGLVRCRRPTMTDNELQARSTWIARG